MPWSRSKKSWRQNKTQRRKHWAAPITQPGYFLTKIDRNLKFETLAVIEFIRYLLLTIVKHVLGVTLARKTLQELQIYAVPCHFKKIGITLIVGHVVFNFQYFL